MPWRESFHRFFEMPSPTFVPWRRAVLVLALAGLGAASATGTLDRQSEEAIQQLAALTGPRTKLASAQPGTPLYQATYWLWVATRSDLSPESVLSLVAKQPGGEGSALCHGQLLADWHIACTYGLLTPENLDRLRTGTAPLATDGRFINQRIAAVQIRAGVAADTLANLAFCPEGAPLPADAQPGSPPHFEPPAAFARPLPTPLVSRASQPPRYVPPRYVTTADGTFHRIAPGEMSTPTPEPPPSAPHAMSRDGIELHDVPFNDSLPIGRTRKLAVASVSSDTLSVSIIGDGPKVRVQNAGYDTYYPRVDNSKVPKINPVRLPGVSADAYLIFSEGMTRYYYVDTIVNNGAAFRIAKVLVSP